MSESALALVDPAGRAVRRIDREAFERAGADVLCAVGVDARAEGLRDTPRRVAGVADAAAVRADDVPQ